jgi:hypothetical protein
MQLLQLNGLHIHIMQGKEEYLPGDSTYLLILQRGQEFWVLLVAVLGEDLAG